METLYNKNTIPTLDLHGLDREYSKILIKDFINDHVKLKNRYILIVHGIGTGILRAATKETLMHNRQVQDFKLDPFNPGATIVELSLK